MNSSHLPPQPPPFRKHEEAAAVEQTTTRRPGLWARSRFGKKVGFRYLRAKKGSSFLSLITGISIGGVGVGVLTMVVTLSVMAGFDREMREKLFSADTHVLVEPIDGVFLSRTEMEVVEKKITDTFPEIQRIYPVLQTEVILRGDQKISGAILKGVGAEQLDWLKTQLVPIPEGMTVHSNDEGLAEIYLGQELSFSLGIGQGDIVTIVSPMESQGPLGAVPLVKKFFIQGLYKTGVPEQELHVVFAAQNFAESFLKKDSVLTQLEIKTKDMGQAEDVTKRLATLLQGISGTKMKVRSWQELNSHLFFSLKLERTVMFCILIFIIIVASFNIISMLTMMVIEKKRSLSILRAMGATPSQVASIFLWEGVAIGMLGVIGGTTIGLIVCWILKTYPILELPDFYYDRTLPVVVDPWMVILIGASTLLIVLVAGVLPAKKASKLIPIQGIRE